MTYQYTNFDGCTLKFENGLVIPTQALLGMWLLIQAGIELNQC